MCRKARECGTVTLHLLNRLTRHQLRTQHLRVDPSAASQAFRSLRDQTRRRREGDSNRRSPQDSDTFETALFAAGEPTLLPKAPAVRTLLPPPFQAEPYPCAPVRDVSEGHDRQMHERGMLEWIEHDEIGRIVVPTPLRFHDTDKSGDRTKSQARPAAVAESTCRGPGSPAHRQDVTSGPRISFVVWTSSGERPSESAD